MPGASGEGSELTLEGGFVEPCGVQLQLKKAVGRVGEQEVSRHAVGMRAGIGDQGETVAGWR